MAAVALFILPFCLTACLGMPDRPELDKTVGVAESAVNDAIYSINQNSNNWQSALRDLENVANKDAENLISGDVANLLDRAVASTATEARCGVDFLATRVKEGLTNLLVKLQNLLPGHRATPLPENIPAVCTVTPVADDLNLPQESRNMVTIDGYNFPFDLRLWLVDGAHRRDVTPALTVVTQDELVINLGANGVQPTSTSNKLVVAWRGTVLAQVPIIQKNVPPCQQRDDSIIPSDYLLSPSQVRLLQGDGDFYGSPYMTADAHLSFNASSVWATVHLSARENGGGSDATWADGSGTDTVYTAAPGWRITGIDAAGTSRFAGLAIEGTLSGTPNTGPVRLFDLFGDTDGQDVGTYTRATVHFNQIWVHLIATTDCRPTTST
jgi:hypothetical protein